MENELVYLVLKSQQGDKDSILEIINRFTPLVKKYSRKLSYDGADSDLIIAFIQIIKSYPVYRNDKLSNDYELLSYISISVHHEYIRLSKLYYKISMNETELNESITLTSTDSYIEDKLFTKELLDKLNVKQRQIIQNIFINGYSESELSRKYQVSRQYINKIKKKALNNLRKHIAD